MNPAELSPEDLAAAEWQLDVPGFSEESQRRLKRATVLISRVGGVGGIVALQLAAAGVGHLILAHAGNLKPSDLNRQLLQTHSNIGKPRMKVMLERLHELNPRILLTGVSENISSDNADRLVASADIVVDAAPLFEERLALNRAAMQARKPMVECAMYAMHAQVTTFLPGSSPCLECLVAEKPPDWKRRFPVLGAISGTAGCIGAVEVVKLITGIGTPLAGRLLCMDLDTMAFRTLHIARRPDCPACGNIHP